MPTAHDLVGSLLASVAGPILDYIVAIFLALYPVLIGIFAVTVAWYVVCSRVDPNPDLTSHKHFAKYDGEGEDF